MPRAGARTLSDLDAPALWIACQPCGRLGRYNVARLMETYGDETLPALRQARPVPEAARRERL